jgi:putative transcriptional regulator
MTRHRPSEDTLAAFAAGRLDEGFSLVVAAHLERDEVSRRRLRELETVQGALLREVEPEPMAAPVSSLLARLDGEAPLARDLPDAEAGLPRVLAPYALGRWTPIGWGIRLRRVAVPGAEARVFLLKAAPGIVLPEHSHSGQEWTTILSGAYDHGYGRYVAGDFDEADDAHEHLPRIDPVMGCSCVVALKGDVVFKGWMGRLLQPLVRL